MENQIDLKGVVARLKQELGIIYDTELSEILGKDPKYISVTKRRETFGGEVWVQIFNIAKEKDINLEWLIYGKLGPSMSAEDVVRTTINNTISDQDERNEAVRRLSEAIVTHRSLNRESQSDDLLDLANILINKLMSEP